MGRLILFFVIIVCVCVSLSPLFYFKGTAKGRRTADHIKTMTRVRKHLMRGEEARAATCLETFMKAHGDVPDMLVLLAEITQDLHQKMTLADRALSLDATHPGAFLQRGLGALGVGDDAVAEENLLAALTHACARKDTLVMRAARHALETSFPKDKRAS